MRGRLACSGVLIVALVACGPPRADDGGEVGEGESGSTTDTTDTTDTSAEQDTNDESGDHCGPDEALCPDISCAPIDDEWGCCGHGGECPPEPACMDDEQLCPDESCQALDPWACCDHGGDCPAPGCEPDDAQTGPDPCFSDPVYGWDGQKCVEVIECACVGVDCPNLPAEPLPCLVAKADCLPAPLEDCEYELAMLELSGTVSGQPWTASHGTFAQIKGEGRDYLELALAPDELTLVNFLFAGYVGERLLNIGFLEGLGMKDANARLGGAFDPPDSVPASVTITDHILDAPDFAGRSVVGSVDVVAEGWDLHGQFEVHGCLALFQVLP